MANTVPGELWWQKRSNERAHALREVVNSLGPMQMSRRKRIQRNLSLYEGRAITSLSPKAYYTDQLWATDSYKTYRVNLARALVATATAKIAGKQKPKAQFCVSDGDWGVRRKAKKQERFVEAMMLSRQGLNSDAYQVGVRAFTDCCYADIGVLKYSPDKQARRVTIERVLPWEFMVDADEARNGNPLNFFHSYGYDKHKLAAKFPKYKTQILLAEPMPDNYVGGGTAAASSSQDGRLIRVDEGWRMAMGEDTPGVHCIAVNGVDLTDGEEWTRQFPPFEFMVWEPWAIGIYGTSLVEIAGPICDELNAAFERWSLSERIGSNVVIDAEEGQYDEAKLASNETFSMIYRKQGSPPAVMHVPETMGQASQNWMGILKGLGYEIPGVSQQAATATQPQAVTAAVAMRTIENIASERFAIQWQAFERMLSVGSARQILACVKDIADDGQDVKAYFASGGILEELSMKELGDFDFPDEAIQVYAVSGLVNTPADRLDLAERLFTMQVISQDAFLRIIQSKDIDSELERNNQQSSNIEKLIEKWLDATPEMVANGKFKPRKPIKWMNKEEAILQVGRAYMKAEEEDCPDWNLKFFVDYMGALDELIQREDAQKAQIAGAAQGSNAGQQAIAPMAGGAPPPPQMPQGVAA